MKKTFLFLIGCLLTIGTQAQQISESQARQIAAEFFSSLAPSHPRTPAPPYLRTSEYSTPAPPDIKLAYTAAEQKLYVYNHVENGGFVIVAGDERAENPILGWSDNGPFDYENAPCGLKALLELYSRGYENSNLTPSHLRTPAPPKTIPQKAEASVGPLLTTQWNQEAPYWNECPDHHYTGCVITALAQVMNYWQWPKQGRGAHQNVNHTDQYRQFGTSSYDWANMLANYETTVYSDTQAHAVAQLMADAGCALDAQYIGNENGTTALIDDLPAVLAKYFCYDEDAHLFGTKTGELFWPDVENYYDYEWGPETAIKKELNEGRPVITGINTKDDNIGHAVVIDGYSVSGKTNYFHHNFGWGGQNDGYYVTGRNEGSNGFDADAILIGIRPISCPVAEKDGLFFNLQDDGARLMCHEDVRKGEACPIKIPQTVVYEGNNYEVTSIYDLAFRYSNVTAASFPSTIKKIPAYLMGHHPTSDGGELYALSFEEGMEEIGDHAFFNNKHLSGSLFLPSTLKRIGDEAFYQTEYSYVSTTSEGFTIGGQNFACRYFDGLENATEIGSYGVTHLLGTYTVQPTCTYHTSAVHAEKVHIPANVNYELDTTVPYYGYEVDSNHPSLSSRDSILYNKDKTTLLRFPGLYLLSNSAKGAIANGVVKIVKGASTSMGNVGSLGSDHVILPASLQEIDDTDISLRSVTCLNPTPMTISAETFDPLIHEYGKSTLRVPIGSKAAYEQAEGWKDFNNICEVLYINGPLVYDFGDDYGNPSDGYAKVVGRNTANNFDGNLVIPEKITVNGKDYFVSSVDGSAFLYDETIQSVSLNTSVYSIGTGGEALVTCPNVHTVRVEEGNDNFGVIGDMLIYNEFGRNILGYCPPKKKGSTIVARDEVTIPSEVDEIGWNVFCDNLHSVTIPANVGSMKPTAFKRCADLMEVRCMGEEPPYYDTMYEKYGHSFNDNVFDPEHGTILYVPKGCKDNYTGEYRYVPEWYLFPDIREFDPTSIETVTVGVQQSGKAYNLQGQQIINEKLKSKNDRSLPKGIYIMNGKKIIVK